MLSFDITDRHVRIIRGSESGNRIKVQGAATIDLQQDLIVNGHVKNVNQLAQLINEELKAKKMVEKEAVVSISSNLVIFKELKIPKAKSTQLLTMVTNQMQHSMGIADDYSVSYSIAGEVSEEGVQAYKILATACPFEVVECYRQLFSMLGITLRSVMVTCNSISRIILSDRKIANKMPLLAVQIDPNFISLNLYEDGQHAFSRFASIDPADYNNSEDYMFEAVRENVQRMTQFQKARNSQNPIQNVMFYGDTKDYIKLTTAFEEYDIATSILNVPSNIGGYENFEFQFYANAIGAMFKSNKESERVNLLETDSTSGKTNVGASFGIAVLISAAIAAAVIAVVCLVFNIGINATEKKIEDINTWINSEDTVQKLADVDATQAKIDKVGVFKDGVQAAKDNYDTLPVVNYDRVSEIIDKVIRPDDNYDDNSCVTFEFAYTDGQYQFTCYCNNPTIPAKVITRLEELDKFDNIVYEGYEWQDVDETDATAETESDVLLSETCQYKFAFTAMDRSSAVEKAMTETEEEETAETEEGGETE